MKGAIRRIVSSSGETLVETLISILVSALALVMLAGAIGSAVNIVRNSKEHMESYYNNQGTMITNAAGSSTDTATVDLGVVLNETDGSEVEVQVYEGAENSGIALYQGGSS